MNKRRKKKKLKNRILRVGVSESSFNMRNHSRYDLSIMANAMESMLNRAHNKTVPFDSYAAVQLMSESTATGSLKEAIQKIKSGDTGLIYSIDSLPDKLFRHPGIGPIILSNEQLPAIIKDLPFDNPSFSLRAIAPICDGARYSKIKLSQLAFH